YSVNGTAFTVEEICLSEDGAFLNPEVVAAVFGKIYKESNQAHFLLTTDIEQSLLDGIENLVMGVPEELSVCIEEFKTIGSWEELKEFFVKYKYLLNLYTDFSDASYQNMYRAYTELDKAEISDYATFDEVIQTIMNVENDRMEKFLEAVNAAAASEDATAIKTLLTDTYKDMVSFAIDTSEVKDVLAIYRKMTGLVYNNVLEIENVFRAAYEAQICVETGKSDAISLSTASRDFDGWNSLAGNTSGGVAKFVKDGENIARISAYAGLEYDKAKTEDAFQNGRVYYPAGAFDNRFSSFDVESDENAGVVSFTGVDGEFYITGKEKAKSNTFITIFDLKVQEGTVSGCFHTGNKMVWIDFNMDGTSVGELSQKLKDSNILTYRVEMSISKVAVYAKSNTASDNEYELVGTTTSNDNSKSNWSVNFVGDDASGVFQNKGIYSALSSVRYETSDYVLLDELYYAADGETGHTMSDLNNTSWKIGSTEVNSDGQLVLKNEGSNSGIDLKTNNGAFKGNRDRTVIELTAKVDNAEGICMYYSDASNYRHGTSYFSPKHFNKTSTGVGSVYKWENGQFFDMKFVA
ncbi:MAG: hypothetical protein IKV88_03060, partial [Clostridia bacterium]|nr:hypothetical protein [Clostridia bacterium]